MSFSIITDSTANIETKATKADDILVIPFSYFIDGTEYTCADTDQFDDTIYYDSIRNGVTVTTSQINPQKYIDFFEPCLQAGKDIVFVGLSSGISGSFASAQMAADQLAETYPDRKICLIDSRGASLGEGLLVLHAVDCRKKGMTAEQTAEFLLAVRPRIYQVFTVDDLMHLRRTGRLSNLSAVVGFVLGIKPLLKGSDEGKIVAFEKIRGRKQAINAMAEKYFSLVRNASAQRIGISHCGCREEAEYLAKMIKTKMPPKEIIIVKHEPVTGSHIGPGSLALYFEGDDDIRYC